MDILNLYIDKGMTDAALELKKQYPNYIQDDDELNIAASKVG